MEAGESCGACHDGDTAFSVAGDCTTCHNRSFPSDINAKGVGTVPFSHAYHTRELGCDDCHPDLFKTEAGANQVGMAKMEEGESCGACHDGDNAFGVKQDCATCHVGAVEIAIQSRNVGTVPFSHSVHTDMFGCDECHPDPFVAQANSTKVGMKRMEQGESCGTCHDDDTAFGVKGDCATCHVKAVDVPMSTRNVGDATFSHEIHTEMYGCNECHPDIFIAKANSNIVGMKAMEQGVSCGVCHDDETAFGVKENCASCHAGDVTFTSFGTIVFSHDLHNDMFGCDECHPEIFTARKGANKATMDDMKFGKSCGACHNGTDAFNVSDCTPCHPR
jgi:c(7)-type cytochrome triheme protein